MCRINLTLLIDDGTHNYSTEYIQTMDTKDILLVISFCIIFIVGVSGNTLVCFLFKPKKNRQLSTMERLIFYLAIADLTASILNPTMFIYWTVTFFKQWHFGMVGCKILPSLTRISVTFSLSIILIITLDRCHVIRKPFDKQLKKKHVNIIVLISLFISILSEFPYTYYQIPNPKSTCQVPDSEIPGFAYPTITIVILRDLLFIFIFSITVFLIYRELYNKEHMRVLKSRKRNASKNKKILHMLTFMAVIFILLVFPRDILHLIFMITWMNPPGVSYTKAFLDLNSLLKVLHMCNSICNVFIYARLHGRFRKNLLRLTKSLLRGTPYEESTQGDRSTIISYSFVESMYRTPVLKGRVRRSQTVSFSLTRMQKEMRNMKRSQTFHVSNNNVLEECDTQPRVECHASTPCYIDQASTSCNIDQASTRCYIDRASTRCYYDLDTTPCYIDQETTL